MQPLHPLRQYRERQVPPLTQDQLAELLGVSKGTVSRWESGNRKVDDDLLPSVSEKTGISPSELRPDLVALLQQREAAE
jgi:transcriptional regulator with XRE-family HTH domain